MVVPDCPRATFFFELVAFHLDQPAKASNKIKSLTHAGVAYHLIMNGRGGRDRVMERDPDFVEV
jgi:hypothetical protein